MLLIYSVHKHFTMNHFEEIYLNNKCQCSTCDCGNGMNVCSFSAGMEQLAKANGFDLK